MVVIGHGQIRIQLIVATMEMLCLIHEIDSKLGMKTKLSLVKLSLNTLANVFV